MTTDTDRPNASDMANKAERDAAYAAEHSPNPDFDTYMARQILASILLGDPRGRTGYTDIEREFWCRALEGEMDDHWLYGLIQRGIEGGRRYERPAHD